MAFPITYPPYILANLALFLKWHGPSTGFPEGEYWQFILVGKSGKVFFYSPVLTNSSVNAYLGRTPFRLQLGDFVDVIHFWVRGHLIYRGNSHYLIHPRQSIFIKNGNAKVPGVIINGMTLARGRAGRKARSISSQKIKSSGEYSGSLVSSNLRPSPETRLTPYTYKSWSKANSTSPWVLNVDTPLTYTGYVRTWTGVRTPGYGKLTKKRLPVNPHTVSIRRTVDGPLYLGSGNTVTGTEAAELSKHTYHYAGAPTPQHNPAAQTLAVARLVSKGQLGIDANLAQDFAQIGQTVELIAGTAKRLTGSLRALRRGNLSEAANVLFRSARHTYRRKGGLSKSKSLAENWLELQYGWKPLLNDVYGTMKSLSSLQEKGDRVQYTKASGTKKSEVVTPIQSWSQSTTRVGSTTVLSRSTCKITISWKIDDHLKAFLAQTGFTNPVNLAWEILPFSFVLDWFLPIGPYLETLSSWDGLAFVEGCQVLYTKQITDSVVAKTFFLGANPGSFRVDQSEYHDEWVIVNRSKLTSFPSSRLPSFKNGLASVTHALNGLALLRGMFR